MGHQVNYKEFACGWGSAIINVVVTYPINKVIFRQMLEGVTARAAAKQMYNEGVRHLYRGMLPPLCQKSISLALMFGVYEECRRPLVDAGYNVYVAKAIAGWVSGSTEAILMPFERVQTLLSQQSLHARYRNMFHVFVSIRRHYGFAEYYRGLVPILIRNGSSNVLFFILRDEIKERWTGASARSYVSATAHDFISGALLGAFLSTIFYPLNVVKVAAQSRLGGSYKSILFTILSVYRSRDARVANIYKGATTNCYRAFISWGVINASYEILKKFVY